MIYIPADLVLLLSAFGVQHWSFTKAKCQFLCTKWALRKWMLNFLFDNPSSVLAFLRRRPALLLFTHMHGMYTQWISQALFFYHIWKWTFHQKMIFIIHYSVHFLATPPSKYPPAPKNKTLLTMMKRMQSGAWKRCSIYHPKKSVQLLENGWHLSSLEKPVGIHLKKDATLRDIYPFWFIFILVKSQSLWLKSPFCWFCLKMGCPPNSIWCFSITSTQPGL